MKKSDLYREWARVLDICEGTNVNPEDCWKFNGSIKNGLPLFDSVGKYEFSVGILEDKPVFVGDKIYSKICVGMVTVTSPISNSGNYSWNPPKKTFMLNGEELPCPLSVDGKTSNACAFLIGGSFFYFDGTDNYKKFVNGICKLLSENTK